jgi:hypothetical protein
MANILTAFDPGTTTGWVEVSLDTFELIDGGQFTAWKQATAERLPLFDDDNITVAYESFVLRRGAYTSDQIEPVYVIGAIEALADGLPIYHYPPSSTKTVTDDVLERLGWLTTPKTANRHQNDAARVAVLACKEIIGKRFMERAWPR